MAYDTCPNRGRRCIASGVSACQDQHKYFLLIITIKTGLKLRANFTYTNLQVRDSTSRRWRLTATYMSLSAGRTRAVAQVCSKAPLPRSLARLLPRELVNDLQIISASPASYGLALFALPRQSVYILRERNETSHLLPRRTRRLPHLLQMGCHLCEPNLG